MVQADFLGLLAELKDGRIAAECGQKLTELVGAIQVTGKGGKLALVLDVKPGARAADASVMELNITADVKTVLPKPDAGLSIFFADRDGRLSRDDPRQRAFNFREVQKEEVRYRDERTEE